MVRLVGTCCWMLYLTLLGKLDVLRLGITTLSVGIGCFELRPSHEFVLSYESHVRGSGSKRCETWRKVVASII
jgi:hypothetical protein